MNKERELLLLALDFLDPRRWLDPSDQHALNVITRDIELLLAQPEQTEQEPSSDDFMYNKLKESYDELVESSFKDFQRGYGAALTHAVYVKEPAREPLSEDEIQDALIKHRRSTIWDCGFKVGVKYAEQKHGISGGGNETM